MKLSNKLKVLAVLGLILCSVGIAYGIYLYHKPHVNVATQKPIQQLTASDLMQVFNENETQANALYLDQIVQVKGLIQEILLDEAAGTTILLDANDDFGAVSCTLNSDQIQILNQKKIGDEVEIKGLCTGMLMDVVLIKCVFIKS